MHPTRVLAELMPKEPEVHGLVALIQIALQAAIAACHARERTAEQTDWGRIAALYDALAEVAPSPVVALNRAVAVAMAFGPRPGSSSPTRYPQSRPAGLPPLAERAGRSLVEVRPFRGGTGGVRACGVAAPQRARATCSWSAPPRAPVSRPLPRKGRTED